METYEAMVSSGVIGDLQQFETPALHKETMIDTGMSWAFDPRDTAVLARNARKQDGPFFCHCGGKHDVHLRQPKFDPTYTPRFCHNSKGKTGAKRSNCRGGGGESNEHYLAKFMLKQHQGEYYFALQKCKNPDCSWELREDCSEGEIRVEYKDDELGWRYDCCLLREGQEDLPLEVYHTNRVSAKKQKSIRSKGKHLAEFESYDVLRCLGTPIESETRPVRLRNIATEYVLCEVCDAKEQARARAEKERMEAERLAKAKADKERKELLEKEKAVRAAMAKQLQEAEQGAGDHIISFGKHYGASINEVDVSYVVWLAGWKLLFRHDGYKYTCSYDDSVQRSDAWLYVNDSHSKTVLAARMWLEGKCWECEDTVGKLGFILCRECFKMKACSMKKKRDYTETTVHSKPCLVIPKRTREQCEHENCCSKEHEIRKPTTAAGRLHTGQHKEKKMRMMEVVKAYNESIAENIDVIDTDAYASCMNRWTHTMSNAKAEATWESMSSSYQKSNSFKRATAKTISNTYG